MPLPFLTLVFIAAGALVLGWLGGLGGASWRDRHRYADVEDRFDSLERRLSKREGAAGQAKRRAGEAADLADLAQLQQLLPRGAPLHPVENEPPEVLEARHRRAKAAAAKGGE